MTREAVAVSKAVGVTTLDGLTDVTITSAATGDVLRYNGTAWVDAVLAIADTSGLQTALDAKLGGSLGSTDNRVLRADGTGGSTAQGSAVTIDDSGNVTGVAALTASGTVTVGGGITSTGAFDLRPTDSSFALRVANNGFYPLTANTVDLGFIGTTSDFCFRDICVGRAIRFQGGDVRVGVSGTTLSLRNLANSTDASLNLANLTASGLIGLGTYTVATLPSASANAGRIAQVTDSNVTTNGSAVSGGGSNRVMVFSNGTTWDVVVA